MESKKSKPSILIKSLHKKKVQESTYDWEKDDKGGTNPNASTDNKKPIARILMKGGKTLTGKDRDTVEIDPVLKTRPNQFASAGTKGAKPSKQ